MQLINFLHWLGISSSYSLWRLRLLGWVVLLVNYHEVENTIIRPDLSSSDQLTWIELVPTNRYVLLSWPNIPKLLKITRHDYVYLIVTYSKHICPNASFLLLSRNQGRSRAKAKTCHFNLPFLIWGRRGSKFSIYFVYLFQITSRSYFAVRWSTKRIFVCSNVYALRARHIKCFSV